MHDDAFHVHVARASPKRTSSNCARVEEVQCARPRHGVLTPLKQTELYG